MTGHNAPVVALVPPSAPPQASALTQHQDLDDDALMLLAAGGDQRAFGALVRRHEQAVRRFLARIVGTADAADLAQESFVKLWRARQRYRAEGRFTVLLYRVAKNTAFSSLRWRKLRTALSLAAAASSSSSSSSSSSPADGDGERVHEMAARDLDPLATSLARERQAELNTILAGLKLEQRVVLVLRHAEGLDYATIASVLGISEENARARASRGTAWLKAALEKRGNT